MDDDASSRKTRWRSPMVAVLLLFLLIIQESSCLTTDEVFSRTPSSTAIYVREGDEDILLECTVQDAFRGENVEVQWSRTASNGSPRFITRNAKLLDKAHYVLDHDVASGKFNLKIKKVSRADTSGKFFCSVIRDDGSQHSTPGTDVVVLVPPGEPLIVSEPKDNVKEGSLITVKCSSSGGSPAASFQWFFHNSSVAPAELHMQQMRGDTVESTIQFHATPLDNGAFVTCAVTNAAMEEGEMKRVNSARLNVLYKPRVTVGPASILAVEMDRMIHLSCAADANPSSLLSYEWKHGKTVFAASNWSFLAENGTDGDYECRATNPIGDGSATVTVQIQYAPRVTVKDVLNPAEGETVLVECTVDAFPKAVAIEWTGPNGFVSNSHILSIPSVTRQHSGNYTCKATNYLNLYGETGSQPREGRATTLVDVKRRPGRGIITPWTLSVVVGGTIELNCLASDAGSPAAKYKWASPLSGGAFGTKEHTRSQLIIRNAQLTDNGEYHCMPFNYIGEGEPGIARVVVIEKAIIARELARERVYDAAADNEELSCDARGFPAPDIQWTKDGIPIDGMDTWTVKNVRDNTSCPPSKFCSILVTSTLQWKRPVEWIDKGNYSCTASNGAEESAAASTWTLARVIHGPVVLNERYSGGESLAAANLSSTAMLICRVSARPEPAKFEWLHDSKEIKEGGRYSMQMNKDYERVDEYENILYISEVMESDYGKYLCSSTNGKGEKAEVVIRLQGKTLPHPSDNLERLGSSQTSIFLAWRPGFDGGYAQTFLIEFHLLNPFTENLTTDQVRTIRVMNSTLRNLIREVDNTNRVTRSKKFSHVMNLVTYNLTSLRPLSTYYVRVRSENNLGLSDFSSTIIAQTDDIPFSSDIVPPVAINYLSPENVFVPEPATPPEHCLMLYVNSGDRWRSVECYTSNRTAEIPSGGDRFKARFCRMNQKGNVVACSPQSRELVASMLSPPYRLALLVPIAVLSFVVLLVCAFLIICCRFKSTPKAKAPIEIAKQGKKQKLGVLGDERPDVSGPLPPIDAKNAPKNGSATDSGVFTLDSSNNAAKSPTKLYGSDRSANYSSNETGVDSWPPNDEGYHGFPGDAYLHEPSYLAGSTYYDGAHHPSVTVEAAAVGTSYDEEEDLDEAYSSGGRRVLREIIV